MVVPPALLSHESTEHYTPQYILDAVIACMGAIDLDPCSNSREFNFFNHTLIIKIDNPIIESTGKYAMP